MAGTNGSLVMIFQPRIAFAGFDVAHHGLRDSILCCYVRLCYILAQKTADLAHLFLGENTAQVGEVGPGSDRQNMKPRLDCMLAILRRGYSLEVFYSIVCLVAVFVVYLQALWYSSIGCKPNQSVSKTGEVSRRARKRNTMVVGFLMRSGNTHKGWLTPITTGPRLGPYFPGLGSHPEPSLANSRSDIRKNSGFLCCMTSHMTKYYKQIGAVK